LADKLADNNLFSTGNFGGATLNPTNFMGYNLDGTSANLDFHAQRMRQE
jgi:hypothetical protein